MDYRKQIDLLLGILVSVSCLILAMTGNPLPVLLGILAIPFLLLIPGNALISALFPVAKFTRLQRFLFIIGSSVGMIIITGLILQITPWKLNLPSWSVAIMIINLTISGLAIKQRMSEGEIKVPSIRFRLPIYQGVFIVLALVVITGAIKLAFTPQPPRNIQGYTSLGISPDPNSQPSGYLVDIHSQEFETTKYELQMTLDGQPLQAWQEITLAPGDHWQQSIIAPAASGKMELFLYRMDNPAIVYRHVSIYLNQ